MTFSSTTTSVGFRRLFALSSAYLIFTTNFIGALYHGRPRKYSRWEEFQRNSFNGLHRRTGFRPSMPYNCCRQESHSRQSIDKFDAYGDDYELVDLRRSDAFYPPRRHQRPFFPASGAAHPPLGPHQGTHNTRRVSLINRVKSNALESFQAFNPFRGGQQQKQQHPSFSPPHGPPWANRRPFPHRPAELLPPPLVVQYGEKEVLSLGEEDYELDLEVPSQVINRGDTYTRILSWLSKFRPSKASDKVSGPSSSSSGLPSDLLPSPGSNLTTHLVEGPLYTFQDVLSGIRRNESNGLLIKKFLSAASALSERSGSDPAFMLWTIPTTLFAFLGLFYFMGAVLILGYKYLLLVNDSANGQAVSLLPVFISFLVPIGLAIVFVTSRGVLNGQISPARVVRGDAGSLLRPDFDPLHFGLDATFGTFTLLGIGWLVSIAI